MKSKLKLIFARQSIAMKTTINLLNINKIVLSFLLIFVLFISQTWAQKNTYNYSGQVIDSETGEVLSFATVQIEGTTLGTVTDINGRFKFSNPESSISLVVNYMGYVKQIVKATAGKAVTIRLESENHNLQEVTISAAQREHLRSTTTGVERLSPKQIKSMPAVLGEVDVLKSIQMMPGVLAASEGSSGYSVRGGGTDQNLILIDEATVYNPSHLLGFFSTFNNDVVSDVTLYKGDLPLRYGGRLSSLLDVQTRHDIPQKWHVNGGIGLLSSRLSTDIPIGSNTSIILGGRRSYLDLFLKMSLNKELRQTKLFFYDLNAGIVHRINDRNTLTINGYLGKDKLAMKIGEFKYGNSTASATLMSYLSDHQSIKTTFAISDYSYSMVASLGEIEAGIEADLRDYSLRADFFNILDNTKIEYGVQGTFHQFQPGHAWQKTTEALDINLQKNKALESGVFASAEHQINEMLSIRYGIRLSVFQNIGKADVYTYNDDYEVVDTITYGSGKIYNTYINPEPRAGLVFNINENNSIKASYARNAQYLQLANNSSAGSPVDIWFPASPNIKPQTSDMGAIGYFGSWNKWTASAEVYYKQQHNVVDFADHSNLMLNDKLEGEIRIGKGRAYGLELSVNKTQGRLTGFANYTLSKSERCINQVNNNKWYLSPYDRTHSFAISAVYEYSARHTFSLSWTYATGTPTTYPSARFKVGDEYLPIYSNRNTDRKPNNHRLDISWTLVPHPERNNRWHGEWNFAIINVYNHRNPWVIQYKQDNGTPYAEMIYLFGIVPSVAYNFKF